MRSFKGLSVVLFSALLIFVAGSVVYADTKTAPVSYAEAVKIASPSVVNVNITRRAQQYRSGQYISQRRSRAKLGSGVIMDEKGYILTNYHVIQNAENIFVALSDGRRTQAKLVGRDPETDLAVIRIRLPNLRPAKLGNSDNLHVGDVVLAIGNPFGLGQTVTQGIISAIGRNTVGINQLENYIQTDAAINPGNSGGALINTKGQVIGINTGIYSRSGGYQGVGFAIPINVAFNVMQQIIQTGHVERGWLGLKIRMLNAAIAQRMKLKQVTGVVVMGVVPKSPAAQANLKVGDVITYLNGHRVRSARGFLNYVAQRKPGLTVQLILWRNQKKQKISITIGKRPPPPVLDDRRHELLPPGPGQREEYLR